MTGTNPPVFAHVEAQPLEPLFKGPWKLPDSLRSKFVGNLWPATLGSRQVAKKIGSLGR
jgi:hypothetical protein